jgi:hypothetical protein
LGVPPDGAALDGAALGVVVALGELLADGLALDPLDTLGDGAADGLLGAGVGVPVGWVGADEVGGVDVGGLDGGGAAGCVDVGGAL